MIVSCHDNEKVEAFPVIYWYKLSDLDNIVLSDVRGELVIDAINV